LEVGNTFSGTSYYKATSVNGEHVTARSAGTDITISRDIMECQMHNASVFAKEEKLPLTKVAQILEDARTSCFTVCFTTKPDDKFIKERLSGLKPADIKDETKLRKISKELAIGKETTLVARLSKAQGKLGRSLVIDLPTQGYRQVDHRTIRWLILKNVKYTVK
jgi:hypothetical protein